MAESESAGKIVAYDFVIEYYPTNAYCYDGSTYTYRERVSVETGEYILECMRGGRIDPTRGVSFQRGVSKVFLPSFRVHELRVDSVYEEEENLKKAHVRTPWRRSAMTKASEDIVLTKENAERVRTSLRAAAGIIELYQATLDQLDLGVSFNAEWPGGEKANVKDLVLESIDTAVGIIDDGGEK